jgi:hypothetical protein
MKIMDKLRYWNHQRNVKKNLMCCLLDDHKVVDKVKWIYKNRIIYFDQCRYCMSKRFNDVREKKFYMRGEKKLREELLKKE